MFCKYRNLFGGAAVIALLGTVNLSYAQTGAGVQGAAGARAGANANAAQRGNAAAGANVNAAQRANAGANVNPVQPTDVNAARRAQAQARVNAGVNTAGMAAPGYDQYWNSYWGWYGNSYRPYWNRQSWSGANNRASMRNNFGARARGNMRTNTPGFETRTGVNSRARLGGGFESRYFNNSAGGRFNNSAGARVGNTAGFGGFGGANQWY